MSCLVFLTMENNKPKTREEEADTREAMEALDINDDGGETGAEDEGGPSGEIEPEPEKNNAEDEDSEGKNNYSVSVGSNL